MKKKLPILDLRLPVENREGGLRSSPIENRKSKIENGFTLIEVMVAMAILTLIVIALMGLFNNTQAAFRASVTQTDVLEGGRAAMDMIADDLRTMSPSKAAYGGNANFLVNNYGYSPLVQTLVGSVSGGERTNILENFFILSSGNQNGVPTWYGTGYAVITNPASGSPLYPLYRFSASFPMASAGAISNLFNDFGSFLATLPFAQTNCSHLIDGVVGLRLRAFDVNGAPINTNLPSYGTNSLLNVPGEVGYYFYSNAVPAFVEIEMAKLEDRALQRAQTWPNNSIAQSNYLAGQAGKVHVFRQRVAIPNVDPTAYQ